MLLHSHYVTHLCVQPSLRVFLGVFYIYSYKILGIKSPDYTEMIQYQIVIKKYHTQENLSIFSFLIPSQEVSIKCSLQIVIKKIISHPQENLITFFLFDSLPKGFIKCYYILIMLLISAYSLSLGVFLGVFSICFYKILGDKVPK